MRPLRTRDDLIRLVAQHAPSRACATAVFDNRALVLGGFTAPECLPCYVVQVRSQHGREWLIAVEIDDAGRQRVKYLDAVPWLYWDGRSDGRRPLIDGDSPTEGAYQRMKARRRCPRND
jgi:hypothetical protein